RLARLDAVVESISRRALTAYHCETKPLAWSGTLNVYPDDPRVEQQPVHRGRLGVCPRRRLRELSDRLRGAASHRWRQHRLPEAVVLHGDRWRRASPGCQRHSGRAWLWGKVQLVVW